jgi:cyanophycinase
MARNQARTPSSADLDHPCGSPSGRALGTLIIIGGREDKSGECVILKEVARRCGERPLVVATVATEEPLGAWREYERVFRDLGIARPMHLHIERREDALDAERTDVLRDAGGIFFTAGDQMKIASKLGGTQLSDLVHALYTHGGVVAGTSAGASAMSETMLAAGTGAASAGVRESLRMAPGLGLTRHMMIDQHFAQRGRIGRLLSAVAQNPRLLGVGIDEDTAVVVEHGTWFQVAGAGAVYVLDGHGIANTTISEQCADVVSVFGVLMHVLAPGDRFDIMNRMPLAAADVPVRTGHPEAATESAAA